MRRIALCVAVLTVLLPPTASFAATAPATDVSEAATRAPQQASATTPVAAARVRTNGGTLALRWNDDLLRGLGLRRDARAPGNRFELAKGSRLEADVSGQSVLQIAGGELLLRGDLRLDGTAGSVEWRDIRGVVRAGEQPRVDFVGDDGSVLFYADSLMYELVAKGQTLSIPTADLRISPTLAQRIDQPEAAGIAIAELSLQAGLDEPAPAAANWAKAVGDPNWPGDPVPDVPGAKYQADVFMTTITAQFMRCNLCDGPGAVNDGEAVFAPNSTLSNNRNDGTPVAVVAGDPRGTSTALYTADVPWYQKFTSSPPNDPNFAYPYLNNDQHPFLIWNLYRIDPVGSPAVTTTITQIGASGVKHAFLTTNQGSQCDTSNGSHVLGRSCADTYSTGNNDSTDALGPRTEIIPAAGQWGRCGSIFDTNCDGTSNATGNGSFGNRMIVRESDLDLTLHPGATFFFESWYIIRDDIDVWNTMATRPFTATWTGSTYTVGNPTPLQLGPAIDRWVLPGTATATARNVEMKSVEGNIKVAAKATNLGNGTWRYDYAVFNADFSRAQTTGSEADHTLRVTSNHGLRRFAVSHAPGTISQLGFADADTNAGNAWVATDTGGAIEWVAPDLASSLDWGRLFRFSFVSTTAPGKGFAVLEPSLAAAPASMTATTVSAGTDIFFEDGFE